MKKICCGIVLLSGISFMSCDLETSDNGELDGMWQLSAVDTLANHAHTDLRETNRSWSFQGKLLELRDGSDFYICEFSREDGVLKTGALRFPDHWYDEKVADMTLVRGLGINEREEQFDIVSLSSSTMVLKSSILQLNFRKY